MAKRPAKPKETIVTETNQNTQENQVQNQDINQQDSDSVKQAVNPEPASESTPEPTSETPNVSVEVVNQQSVDTEQQNTVTENSTVVNQPEKKITTLEDFITLGTSEQKTLVETLFAYREAMLPKKFISESDGVLKQYYLWKSIQSAIDNSTNESFNILWSILLAFAQRYKDDCFHEKYIYRFAHRWNWSADELEAFQNAINLIKATCDPEKRSVGIKSVSLEKTLAKVFTEEGRQRINIFYNR